MLPFTPTPTGLHLRLRPHRRPRGTLSDGTAVLRLRVRAVPEGGRANAAVTALFARALGLPKSAVTLVAGGTAQLKTVRIDDDHDDLAAKVGAL